jgi:hypothetical protein
VFPSHLPIYPSYLNPCRSARTAPLCRGGCEGVHTCPSLTCQACGCLIRLTVVFPSAALLITSSSWTFLFCAGFMLVTPVGEALGCTPSFSLGPGSHSPCGFFPPSSSLRYSSVLTLTLFLPLIDSVIHRTVRISEWVYYSRFLSLIYIPLITQLSGTFSVSNFGGG